MWPLEKYPLDQRKLLCAITIAVVNNNLSLLHLFHKASKLSIDIFLTWKIRFSECSQNFNRLSPSARDTMN